MIDVRRALVVDDDPTIRATLQDGLEDDGFEVRVARDGLVALEVLADWTPDVILLDLMMPRMDGWTFRQEQRRMGRAPGVPVVVLSASRNISEHMDELGTVTVLPKPFDLEHLLEMVDQLCRVA